jgi:uncharacterized protein (TIGR02271 family)
MGKEGLQGTLVYPSQLQGSGERQVLVRLDDGQEVRVPLTTLVPKGDGNYYLLLNRAEIEEQQYKQPTDEIMVVPVIAEELHVQARPVETGGVRITKSVHEREEVLDEPLWGEKIEVERIAVNRVVEHPPAIRHEGDTMIVPILEEVLVVEKRLMVKEEIHITKQRVEKHAPQRVTLRREEAVIERMQNPPQKEDMEGTEQEKT